MKIKWTLEALEKLIEIEDFISKDSTERAVRFVDQIMMHSQKAFSPARGEGTIYENLREHQLLNMQKKYWLTNLAWAGRYQRSPIPT